MQRIYQIIILFFSTFGVSGCLLDEYKELEAEREEQVKSVFISDNRLYILGETLDLQSSEYAQSEVQSIQQLLNDYGKYIKEIYGYISVGDLGSESSRTYMHFRAYWDLSGLKTEQKLRLARLLLPKYYSPGTWSAMEEEILSGKSLIKGMIRDIPLVVSKIQNRDDLIEQYPVMATYFKDFTKIHIEQQTEHSKVKQKLNNATMVILSPAVILYCIIEGGCIPKG
ncbi:hypothetical protein [Rodentibacter sp. Ppn85]|uniref:hypothetical protein n=1 Tax=Rodentibacter sp. Ppn85 TaxID=1908525 RepID=UPI000986883C|nr:hypothetical protein [Rodentibacter sp. Ppn85]OOF65517.1 hypothetical protein BKL51_05130 [Rodentibacter sp. Ppn85]